MADTINKIFSYPIIIKEVYLDTFGHMNHATYLTLFEEARWDFATKNGYGMEKIQETGLGPTILELKLRFLKELRLRQEVIIETSMLSYRKKIGILGQRMVRDGEICCEAEFVWSLFDLKKRKLVMPTADWLRAIGMET
jgi:YbgC/YbaW family acyl-CoA thioester hydrolase